MELGRAIGVGVVWSFNVGSSGRLAEVSPLSDSAPATTMPTMIPMAAPMIASQLDAAMGLVLGGSELVTTRFYGPM